MTEQNIPNRIDLSKLKVFDLEDPERLAEAEAALQKQYPGLDLSPDPAHALLEGRFAEETERAIAELAG